MNIEIFPSKAEGVVKAPASKSYAHRLLMGAALSDGISEIKNIVLNDDVIATAECLKKLGADISFNGQTAIVKGIETAGRKKEVQLFCNESGSTLRFLIPLSLVFFEKAEFSGSERLLERPQTVFEELFKKKNCSLNNNGRSINVSGTLNGGIYEIRGDVSSQFITGLLFTLPLLDSDSEIVLTTPLQSEPYVNITTDVLSQFGIKISKTEKGYYIKGNQKYKSRDLYCEGDWSNSAFLHAFNLFDGNVCVSGLNCDSVQGDKTYIEFYNLLKDCSPAIDISDCPDLGPILIACSALLNGATITGTSRLKIKESDRGEAMRQELLKFGCDITVESDAIYIKKQQLHKPSEPVNCHNDHRIAMSMAVVSSIYGAVLEGAECVNKSYSGFFDDLKTLGITFKNINTQY